MNVEAFWKNGVWNLRLNGQVFGKSALYALEWIAFRVMVSFQPLKYYEAGRACFYEPLDACGCRDIQALVMLLWEEGLLREKNGIFHVVNPQYRRFLQQVTSLLRRQGGMALDDALKGAYVNGQHVRLFYGNGATGEDGLVQKRLTGRLWLRNPYGYSIGPYRKRNPAFIDREAVVKVTRNRETIYQHPDYHLPELTIQRQEDGQSALCAGGRVLNTSDDPARMVSLKEYLEGIRNVW